MFPERPQPSIASLLDNEHEDSKKKSGGGGDGGSGSGGSKSTIDYLADYGGTIGIISIGIIGALIYSYYESIQDRNRVEDKVSNAVKIEPYEIQELRYLNQLTYDQYCTLCNRVIQVHREGSSSSSSIIIHGSSHTSMSYRVFIDILVEFAKSHQLSFRSMHLLDRLVLAYLTTKDTEEDKKLILSTTETTEAIADTTVSTNDKLSSKDHVSSIYSDDNGSSKEDLVVKNSIVPLNLDLESLIPLPILLAMLHLLLLTDDIGDRIKGFCYAASLLDDIATTEAVDSRSLVDDQEIMNIQSSTQQKQDDGSRQLSINTTSSLSFSAAVEQQQQHLLSISRRSLEMILEALLVTDQVPPGKQVVETGVKWPIKLHRRKGPCDMVEEVS